MSDDDDEWIDPIEAKWQEAEGPDGEHFLRFKDIPAGRRLSNRPDLNAFLMLDAMFPAENDIVSGASHDEIYLSINAEDLVNKATPEQLRDLVRSGVRYDGGICMFT